jgi:hypothetical protein
MNDFGSDRLFKREKWRFLEAAASFEENKGVKYFPLP